MNNAEFLIAKWNTKIVSLTDMFRATIVALEIAMLEPKTQVGGVHVILSFDGLSLSHIAQFTPSIAKTILDWVQVTFFLNLCKILCLKLMIYRNAPLFD